MFNPRPSGCDVRAGSAGAASTRASHPEDGHAPRILLRGYTLGTGTTHPHCVGENTYQVSDNFTLIYNAAGRHELRVGGEYLHTLNHLLYPAARLWTDRRHRRRAAGQPVRGYFSGLERLPTWNLAALSPVTRFYTKAFADGDAIYDPMRHLCRLAPERLDAGQAAHPESGVALRPVARLDRRSSRRLRSRSARLT